MIQALLLLLAVSPAGASSPDVQAFLQQARQLPAPQAAAPKWGRHLYWLEGCKTLTLGQGQARSERFELFSTEMVEECDFDARGGMRCFRSFGMTERRSTQLELRGRPAAAPAENFQVCLNGPQLYVALIGGPTRYDVAVGADAIVLTAKTK